MAKTLLAMVFLSANLLHFPHGPAHARRLVEALFTGRSEASRVSENTSTVWAPVSPPVLQRAQRVCELSLFSLTSRYATSDRFWRPRRAMVMAFSMAAWLLVSRAMRSLMGLILLYLNCTFTLSFASDGLNRVGLSGSRSLMKIAWWRAF